MAPARTTALALDKARATALVGMQRMVMAEAGDALARWVRGKGYSPAELQAGLDDGSIELHTALQEALAGVDPRAIAEAHGRFAGLVDTIEERQYWSVLKRLEANAGCIGHAQVLGQPHYYHTYFLPAMRELRSWFTGRG